MTNDLVVIPLPTKSDNVTYAVARLVSDNEGVFAEAIMAVPHTIFAPHRAVALQPDANPGRFNPSANAVFLRRHDPAAAVAPTAASAGT